MLFPSALWLLSLAQVDPVTVVAGKVRDASTELPVAGARVILVRLDRQGSAISLGLYDAQVTEGDPDPKADRIAVLTGEDGAFRFRIEAPARFALFVDAAGFVRTPTGISPDTWISVKAGSPRTDIFLRLTRELNLGGRVIDVDTGQPVPGLEVRAHRYRSISSGRILIPEPGGAAKTGEAGQFQLVRLPPGEYYLEVRLPVRETIGEPKPVEDFRRAVRRTYAPTWYPGVARAREGLPVRLFDGMVADSIEIQVAKRGTAAVRGRVFSDVEGEANLSLVQVHRGVDSRGFQVIARGTVQTGAGFEIDQLSSGSYYVQAYTKGQTAADRRWAVLPLEIGEENQDGLDLYLRRPVSVSGQVRIEGHENRPGEPVLPADGVRIGLWRVVGMAGGGDPGPALVERQDGSFQFDGVIADRYQIYVSTPPQGTRSRRCDTT